MLEKYIPKRFATAMIKHVIAATLFFPYIYSHNNNVYYQDFVLPNFFAILSMVFIFTSWKLDFKRNAIFVSSLGILLLAYNVCATYMNVKYHHWYGEQINTTISFLFFMVLLMVKDIHALIDTATIKATIHMIVASNVLAIGCCNILKYTKILLINDWVNMTPKLWWYTYFSWLYGHKSEYAFILILCIAFFAINKKIFHNNFTYMLSQGILFYSLYLSNVYTSMVAALCIFIGQFLDYLITAKWWKKLLTVLTITPTLLLVAIKLLSKIETDRDLLTLGYRIPIWKQFFFYTLENPNGLILDNFGTALHEVAGIDFLTNNAHNIFLNHMIRFSILVGGCYLMLFAIIILFSLKRRLHFRAIFIWISILIPLNMDYSMLSIELSFFLLTIFMLFFTNPNSSP